MVAVGGPEFAALLLPDVQELLTNGAVRPIVRKKAALALLRLLRKSTSDIEELLQHDVRELILCTWSCHPAGIPCTAEGTQAMSSEALSGHAAVWIHVAPTMRTAVHTCTVSFQVAL